MFVCVRLCSCSFMFVYENLANRPSVREQLAVRERSFMFVYENGVCSFVFVWCSKTPEEARSAEAQSEGKGT